MNWLLLIIAGLLEIGWALSLKYSQGLTKPLPSIVAIVLVMLSLSLLSLALKTLPVGPAYGVWTGIGTIGTALVGIIVLGESAHPARLVCLALIAIGIIGLRVLPEG